MEIFSSLTNEHGSFQNIYQTKALKRTRQESTHKLRQRVLNENTFSSMEEIFKSSHAQRTKIANSKIMN